MRKLSIVFTILFILLGAAGCRKNTADAPTVTPSTLSGVPALRLNFRFENDVPAPTVNNQTNPSEEKNNTVQADFDQNRPEETLNRTIPSPDKKRLLAVFQKLGDGQGTYRLAMYSAEGKLVQNITPNGLSVYFPDTIIWSPDSNNVAFVGMIRVGQAAPTPLPDAPTPPNLDDENANVDPNSNSNSNDDLNANTNTAPTVEQAKQVLTFRTEQIYTCSSDGGDLKPLTQNEGYRYFYFVWSPDSSALISLAATWREFDYEDNLATQRGEVFVPRGRPRLVEKTGRIRLLDDNLTAVHPVWSPDSSKIALGFDKEIRIYDGIRDAPTQAAIPLRNQLLISSKTYDEEMKLKEGLTTNTNTNINANTKANTNTNTNVAALPQDVNTLPDERSVVSFLPIVQLEWTDDKILYLQTGFVRDYKDSTQNTRNNMRWHRLLLSPQAVKLN